MSTGARAADTAAAGIGLVVVAFVTARSLATLWTDYLWYDSVGHVGVWTTLVFTKVWLVALASVFAFVAFWINLFIADRLSPRLGVVTGSPDEELLERYQMWVEPRARWLRIAAAAFFGGLTTSGILARAAVNHSAGGRSRASGVVNAIVVLLLVVVLARPLALIPKAAIAGLIMVIASGLFDRWAIPQVTSIWWMNDVEGGGFSYWPDGPEKPRRRHANAMANTALVGDNHGMFHQVGPVGPFDQGTRLVTPRAQLAPAADGRSEWAVTDRGEVRYQAPLEQYRVSVLWKADVYRNEAEQRRQMADTLSIPDVARIFDRDLKEKGAGVRIDLDRLDDPGLSTAVNAAYPEAVPVGKRRSMFDGA